MKPLASARQHRSQTWFPAAVLVAGLGLTALATISFFQSSDMRAQRRFDGAVAEAQEAIHARLQSYVALLRGGAALLSVKPETTRSDWREYVARLRLPEFYRGVQGIGFTLRMLPDETNEVVAQLRAEGATNFAIHPNDERPEYHAIVYLEPMDRRNLAALGYDMFTEATRRTAMERAWHDGEPAASGKVRLVQEIEGPEQAGFLIYLPVYHGITMPESLEARHKTLRGFVYSPFRADDFFHGVFGKGNPLRLGLEVFDGAQPVPEARLHLSGSARQSPKPRFSKVTQLDVAGRPWTLVFTSTPAFEANTARGMSVLVAGLALLLTLALYHFARHETRLRQEAERSAAELEQKVAERTAKLSEVIGELEGFSYSVSHDLRAPLRAMQSYANILVEECSAQLSEQGRDYTRRIAVAAQRMDRLIKDVLTFSRIARAELPLETLSIERLLRDTIDSYPMFQAPAAEIVLEGTFPRVRAHEAVLTQCISNLLGNAVKFVPPGVQPRVRVRAESLSDGKRVRLYFEDNGVGIDPADHEKIFDMFHRATRGYDGTGIGLAIVKKGIERMAGQVGVESRLGAGSTFWLELQRAD